MADFGGLGGCATTPPRNKADLFEEAVDRCMGKRMRTEGRGPGPKGHGTSLGARLWGSLANFGWKHEARGDTAGYSFRAAGDLIAAVVGKGNYMDWYCCAPYGEADPEVAELLASEGWTPDEGYYDD